MTDTSQSASSRSSDDDGESSAQRGLLGRLLEAFAPPDRLEERKAERSQHRHGGPSLSHLRRLRVADVMIPRVEIVAVPVDIGREELLQVIRETGFSRLPVYQGTLDHPLGLLHLKDLVLRYGLNADEGTFDLRSLLRPLLYVPASMPLIVLFQKMQTERIHMALVIDEYGGVEGLVTIEYLLEQVVGEIDDEYDTERDSELWRQEAADVWVLEARTELEEFRAATGIDLTEGIDSEDVDEIDTLGGLVFILAGRVPVRGEVIAHPAGWDFEVLDADLRRVKRLRLRRAPARAVARD